MSQLVFVIIVANILILLGLFRNYVNPRVGRWWLILSIVVISVLFALIVPKDGYDLTRHYENLVKARETGMGLFQYVFRGAGSMVDSNYRSMFTYNALMYVIANFLPKETLPLASMLVCYGVFGYILFDVQKRIQMSGIYIAASILLSNCLLPVLYVYSGVRNEMAVAVMGLAIYRRIFKKSHLISFLILCLIAGTLHPIVLVAIPFLILSRVKPGFWGLVVAGFIPMALYPLMEVFRDSRVDFLKYLGAKFYNYTFVHVYYQGRVFLVVPIVVTLAILILSYFRAKNTGPQNQRFVNFVCWYSIFALANFRSYQIVMRLPYLLGILSPVVICTLFWPGEYKYEKAYLPQVMLAGTLGLSGVALLQNYLWVA